MQSSMYRCTIVVFRWQRGTPAVPVRPTSHAKPIGEDWGKFYRK